jgi:hypothetical protein
MRAAHAFLTTLTVLFLAGALPLAPAEAFPSLSAANVLPTAASTGKAPRHTGHYAAGPRPAHWCGWWMRTQLGGGPKYNLAQNWAHWGHPSGPRVGAVVVWTHHVGLITGRTASGEWIVKSGNDGGRVRERPRSVAGAVFRVG